MPVFSEKWEPQRLFQHFEEISAIPRPSGKEKAVSDFLMDFARRLGLPAEQDSLWNVVIRHPGAPGCENTEPVLLQGHLDMVCEKEAGSSHDFSREGLELEVRDHFLYAKGTTLGADNGAAAALMMTILEDVSLSHPPLECVFTVQEETGMAGARGLDFSRLRAQTLINLDSEEEGIATVSCAGGSRVRLWADCTWDSPDPSWQGVQITLGGLRGGHSGMDIGSQRGNAPLLMARLLSQIQQKAPLRLGEFSGGERDNAIPRECRAVLAFPAGQTEQIQTVLQTIRAEWAHREPGLWIEQRSVPLSRALSPEQSRRFLDLLLLLPNGAFSRHESRNPFVVSSSNLGMARLTPEQAELTLLLRSSVASAQEYSLHRLERLAALAGFSMETVSDYPGWAYQEHSPIRELLKTCYREQTGKELRCEAIHAGLECGLFLKKRPTLDAIAIGPDILGCHTPEERMDLASFQRTYRLLAGVLERLAQGSDSLFHPSSPKKAEKN